MLCRSLEDKGIGESYKCQPISGPGPKGTGDKWLPVVPISIPVSAASRLAPSVQIARSALLTLFPTLPKLLQLLGLLPSASHSYIMLPFTPCVNLVVLASGSLLVLSPLCEPSSPTTSLVIREMQTQTTFRFCFTSVKMAIVKKTNGNKRWQRFWQRESLILLVRMATLYRNYGEQYGGFPKD